MTDPPVQRHVSKHLFLTGQISAFGTQEVLIIHNEGGDDEQRTVSFAHVQSESGFFEVDTPIYDGDVVDVGEDPRDGRRDRRLVSKLKVNKPTGAGFAGMEHIHVEWADAPDPRVAAVRRLTFENLHQRVRAAAGDLYADGHHRAAVVEAFKSIEVRVRDVTGIDRSGAPLMGDAFRKNSPAIDVATEPGQSGQDEREGFLALFRGAMLGIRNPGAHELFRDGDAHEALEYLALASLLHRRIDQAKTQAPNPAP